MPPKKKPPQKQHKHQAPPAKAAKPKEKRAMTDMPFPPGTGVVSTANSTEAEPRTHMDLGAQRKVNELLDMRVAMAPKNPPQPPVPPGMKPNQIVAWASVSGTVAGAAGAGEAPTEPVDPEAPVDPENE